MQTLENQGLTQLLIGGVKRCPLLIHYGSHKFIPEKVLPIKNNNWVKPRGGLWTSPIDSKWGWKDWNDSELFRDCNEKNSFTVCLKPDAKIFVIDSLKDLENSPLIDGYHRTVLNFELIAKNYDAIWLTEEGLYQTHLSYSIDLFGWDCETVLIFNPDCCINIKP